MRGLGYRARTIFDEGQVTRWAEAAAGVGVLISNWMGSVCLLMKYDDRMRTIKWPHVRFQTVPRTRGAAE